MKEITLNTKISELLNDYDGMKDILIDINPKFKKLNNPILRRTIAKVASVKQAAIVGGMKPLELLNRLREAVGQEPLNEVYETDVDERDKTKPTWTQKEIKLTLDANEMLDNGLNPLAELYMEMKKIEDGDIILIKSDFQPEPLIDEYLKKGHEVYCEELNESSFLTYIKK